MRPSGKLANTSSAGAVRIIGGLWRGSKLPVPMVDGLRPSGDRMRETLFNWLQPVLPGAQVLDVFAGTGVLGLEALSRGAAHACLLERDRAAATLLGQSVVRLAAQQSAQVVNADALMWLRNAGDRIRFDIAFIDPPFAAGLWDAALDAVLPLMSERGWLYVESPPEVVLTLPAGWGLHREMRSRYSCGRLYRRLP